MNKGKDISEDRKKYLKKQKSQKILVKVVQISIVIAFLAIWEVLANKGIIDSFIMSQPSRIIKTFLNLSSNNILEHIKVTCIETLIGFLLGTFLGSVIAIMLWWSKFLSKVSEPFLVVLNSLPKVALRTSYNNLGRGRNASNYSNGTCNCDGGLMTTNTNNLANVLDSKEKIMLSDNKSVSYLLSKIKENGTFNKKIKLKVETHRKPKEVIETNRTNFAEQMIYFRRIHGYTQKQVAKAIGISEGTYSNYEENKTELTNIKIINRILKFLEFTEEPKVSDYVKFLMSNPEKMLEKYLKENKISKNKFSQLSGISRRAMLDWFNHTKGISKESYEKIEKFITDFEKSKEHKRAIEDEEEME